MREGRFLISVPMVQSNEATPHCTLTHPLLSDRRVSRKLFLPIRGGWVGLTLNLRQHHLLCQDTLQLFGRKAQLELTMHGNTNATSLF